MDWKLVDLGSKYQSNAEHDNLDTYIYLRNCRSKWFLD